MSITETVAGIDCGKHTLDVALFPGGDKLRVDNTPAGHGELVAWLAGRGVVRAGLEASGGYERAVRDALSDAGVAVAVFDPARVRHYAKATGRRAKNDPIDAAVIAEFTALPGAPATAAPDPEREELADLVKARRLLVDKRADLSRARSRAPAAAEAALDRAIAALDEEIATLEAAIGHQVEALPSLARTVSALRTAPGVGPVTAVTLAVRVPELGRISGKKIAALLGVAPYDRDSGTAKGPRHVAGGRADARRALYMAAEVAATRARHGVIADYYARLIAHGKPPKVALTACMHKLIVRLNAMLAKHGVWQAQPA